MKPHIDVRELTIAAATMVNVCNIDGRITAEAEARIHVLDRGFLFGDSVYEVLRTYGDVPFAWPEHWRRLQASASALRLQLDIDEPAAARRVAATIGEAGPGDHYVRLIVTRGVGTAPNIDLAFAPGPPTWIVLVRDLPPAAGRPVRLQVVDRLRTDRRALDPAAKSGNYLNSVLGLAEAKDAGATDCVMLNTAGEVTEASTANLFARIDDVWCTPALDCGILPGITRELLLDWLPSFGERATERRLSRADLHRATELFLSSTLRDIAPVTHLDGRAIAGGSTGPATARLMPAFAALIDHRLHSRDQPLWRLLVD